MAEEEGIIVEVDANYVKKHFMSPPALVLLDSSNAMVEQRALVVGRNFLQYSDIAGSPSIAAVIFKKDDSACIKSNVVPCVPGGLYTIQVEGGGPAGADIHIELRGMRREQPRDIVRPRTVSLVMSRDKTGTVYVSDECLTNLDEITEELHFVFRYPETIDCIGAIVKNPYILAKAYDGSLADTPYVIQAGSDGSAKPSVPRAPMLPARLRAAISTPNAENNTLAPPPSSSSFHFPQQQPQQTMHPTFSSNPYPSPISHNATSIGNGFSRAPPPAQQSMPQTTQMMIPNTLFSGTRDTNRNDNNPKNFLKVARAQTDLQSTMTPVPPALHQQYMQKQYQRQLQQQQQQFQQQQQQKDPNLRNQQYFYEYAPSPLQHS